MSQDPTWEKSCPYRDCQHVPLFPLGSLTLIMSLNAYRFCQSLLGTMGKRLERKHGRKVMIMSITFCQWASGCYTVASGERCRLSGIFPLAPVSPPSPLFSPRFSLFLRPPPFQFRAASHVMRALQKGICARVSLKYSSWLSVNEHKKKLGKGEGKSEKKKKNS